MFVFLLEKKKRKENWILAVPYMAIGYIAIGGREGSESDGRDLGSESIPS